MRRWGLAEKAWLEETARKLFALLKPLIEGITTKLGERVDFMLILGSARPGLLTWIASHDDRGASIQLLREMAAKIQADPRTAQMSARHLEVHGAPPVRFSVERYEPGRPERLRLEQLEGGHLVQVSVDGRLAGVLSLMPDEERALLDRILREETGPDLDDDEEATE